MYRALVLCFCAVTMVASACGQAIGSVPFREAYLKKYPETLAELVIITKDPVAAVGKVKTNFGKLGILPSDPVKAEKYAQDYVGAYVAFVKYLEGGEIDLKLMRAVLDDEVMHPVVRSLAAMLLYAEGGAVQDILKGLRIGPGRSELFVFVRDPQFVKVLGELLAGVQKERIEGMMSPNRRDGVDSNCIHEGFSYFAEASAYQEVPDDMVKELFAIVPRIRFGAGKQVDPVASIKSIWPSYPRQARVAIVATVESARPGDLGVLIKQTRNTDLEQVVRGCIADYEEKLAATIATLKAANVGSK